MHRAPTTSTHTGRSGHGRIVLAMLAGAALSLAGGHLLTPQTAEAQRHTASRSGSGILNPADQRNEMIQELRKISAKMGELEKSLDKALDVNVVTMPASFGASATNGD